MNPFQSFWEKQWKARGKSKFSLWKLYPLALIRSYFEESITEDAQSLVYVTLLTLVPLLAVAFALLQGFGVEGVIEPWLRDIFAPMGEAGKQVVAYLLNFVTQTKASSLGIIGVVFLFVSIINLAQKIETALNHIWQIDSVRDLKTRITGYVSTILLAPLLIGAIMSGKLGMKNAVWLQHFLEYSEVRILFELITSGLSLIVVFLVIAALYALIPNRHIKWQAALSGSAFFLILWFPISWIFSRFIAGSQNYSVIYSSFASAVILLIWLNFLWLIFLLGAKFSSLVQLSYLLAPNKENDWFADEQTKLGIATLSVIGEAFENSTPAPTEIELLNILPSQPYKIHFICQRFLEKGLIIASNDEPAKLFPAKALKNYKLNDIYQVLRLPDDRYDCFTPKLTELEAEIDIALLKPLYGNNSNDVSAAGKKVNT